MGYYFKMYKNDLENFFLPIAISGKCSLPVGLIEVAFGPVIKSFSCTIVEEYISTINENESLVTLEIEQNIDKETNNRTIILVPRNYPLSDKIKVHLANYMDEAYIDLGYDDYRKNKVKYYFTLTKDEYKSFVYKNGDTQSIITAIWNDDHTDFTFEDIPIEPVITVSPDPDLFTFCISGLDSRYFFSTNKNSHNAYEKVIYLSKSIYKNNYKNKEFFTSLDDCLRFTKSKREKPGIINKLEEQCSWDCKPLNMLKKETKMTIKDIKRNGPATIIFWFDGDKTVVKCQPGDQDDVEKGVIMALVKGIQMRYKGYNFDGHRNWTNIFDIPYADEIDVEKVIGLAFLREWFTNPNRYDHEWHYNYVLKWVYKIKGYKYEDEVAALKAHGYSNERIMKCLKTTKGKIREALGQDLVYKKEQKIPAEAKSNEKFIDHIKMPSGDEYKFTVNKEETKKVLKDIIQEDSLSEKVIKMFNDGTKIAKIAKSLGISEYFVKKALDEATKPKSNPKKTERILKKATKEKIVHKKHVRHTQIEYPDYLDKETCDKILERTKEKYKDHDKIQYLSELQKYFIMECKREYIMTHYGNGYDMYAIAKVIGTNAASVQRIWNAYKSGKEK